jgi:hypothetical protein
MTITITVTITVKITMTMTAAEADLDRKFIRHYLALADRRFGQRRRHLAKVTLDLYGN